MSGVSEREPAIIVHTLASGENFDGSAPAESPKIEGAVYLYEDRKKGGLVRFSNSYIYRVKQITLQFKDASSWNIKHQKQYITDPASNNDPVELTLFDSTDSDPSDFSVDVLSGQVVIRDEFILSPDDALLFNTTGATDDGLMVEVVATPEVKAKF